MTNRLFGMKKSRMISLTAIAVAVALAGSSVWLYLALKSARTQRHELLALPAPALVERIPNTSTSRTEIVATPILSSRPIASAGTPPAPGDTPPLEDASTTGQHPDPTEAANRMKTARAALTPIVADMTSFAGLDKHESDQLLNFMAESLVRGQEAQTKCGATPSCDIAEIRAEHQRAGRNELERILPPFKLQRIDYLDESARVDIFRRELPSGLGLSETLASELALALSDERFRIADYNETNEEFNGRLYNRAQSLLTPEQLAIFQNVQGTHFARGN